MVITDIVINTLLGRLTLDPAGMHCPAGDDAFVSSYRQDAAKRQTAGIRFTHRPKIRFFAPQGRLVAPIQVILCRTDVDPRAVAVSCYGWLKTSYGWLAS